MFFVPFDGLFWGYDSGMPSFTSWSYRQGGDGLRLHDLADILERSLHFPGQIGLGQTLPFKP